MIYPYNEFQFYKSTWSNISARTYKEDAPVFPKIVGKYRTVS